MIHPIAGQGLNLGLRDAQALEWAGQLKVVAFDKTGTLTQNRMTVSHIFLGLKIINAEVNLENYANDSSIGTSGAAYTVELVRKFCNTYRKAPQFPP